MIQYKIVNSLYFLNITWILNKLFIMKNTHNNTSILNATRIISPTISISNIFLEPLENKRIWSIQHINRSFKQVKATAHGIGFYSNVNASLFALGLHG